MIFKPILAGTLLAVSACGWAVDYSVSGFGTVGYAKSDKSYAYERFIDKNGTFNQDSLFGVQVDAKFSPQWSATYQAKYAPSQQIDGQWDVTTAWAFASWRPNDDWLLRLGKMRVPTYLYSQYTDVGAAYDFVRLPVEVYAFTPSTDFIGANVTRSWALDAGDLSFDIYHGATRISRRLYLRDTGPRFADINVLAEGIALSFKTDTDTYRAAFHHYQSSNSGKLTGADYPLQDLGTFLGHYYVVDPQMGTLPQVKKFHNYLFTLGAEVDLGGGYRVVGEYAKIIQNELKIGVDASGGYLSLLKQMGDVTPYVTVAGLRSKDSQFRIQQNLLNASVSSFVTGATQINAAQQATADALTVYDQSSLAVGASYALTPKSKVKAEWMRTWVGQASQFVDSPAGGRPVNHTTIDVLSFNYSFTF
ncbi:hypothetical protein DLREEDagrD3_08170 [Denitratisoma sp. agr-D3]